MNDSDPDNRHDLDTATANEPATGDGDHQPATPIAEPRPVTRRSHGRWLMAACCLPMLGVALVFALAGGNWSILVIAAGCALLMTLLMMNLSAVGADSHATSYRPGGHYRR